jgi:metal transporter CNNM
LNPIERQYLPAAAYYAGCPGRGNMLLCTLLIGNTVVNVMLSVLTDPIWTYIFGSGTAGALLSLALPSALIVIFGEIIPQSVCSRHALLIGARTLPITYFFVLVTGILAYPISVILDKLLGDEITGVYTRQGLFELIKLNIHSAKHAKESGLTREDGRLLGGALTFKDRKVGEVMTPLESVFSLPISAVLNLDTHHRMLAKGFSRIPVYEGEQSNIVAVLLVKTLLGIGFERNLALRQVLELSKLDAREVRRVHCDTPLNVALDVCKHFKRHVLVVTDTPEDPRAASHMLHHTGSWGGGRQTRCKAAAGVGAIVGIVTLEDLLEAILDDEIVDETDVYVDNISPMTGMQPPQLKRLNSRKLNTTAVLDYLSSDGQKTKGEVAP